MLNHTLIRWLLPLLVLTLVAVALVAVPALHTFAAGALQHVAVAPHWGWMP
jgi:hypothetical protein